MPKELPCFVDDHTRTATCTDPRRAFAVVHLSTGSLTFKGGECDLHPLAACTSLTTTLEQLLGTTHGYLPTLTIKRYSTGEILFTCRVNQRCGYWSVNAKLNLAVRECWKIVMVL